ncbi:MAG: hypothetical protein GF398_00325 [Chitinivibrionales bacterium]|nr:hypothetical protein [Chitinivibrionales bacterium]
MLMSNRKLFRIAALLGITCLHISLLAWRSSLYPQSWQPGYTDSEGRFLHDFSYAGYHAGEKPIPHRTDHLKNVTTAPYEADNSGSSDATGAIQQAIADVESDGGGVVYLPAGTYRISPQDGKNYCLRITGSNVVLRGAGTDQTFMYTAETSFRKKAAILVSPEASASWRGNEQDKIAITEDLLSPVKVIPVSSVAGYSVGNWIVLRTNCTSDFIAEHGMTNKWNSSLGGICFYRYITGINAAQSTLSIDAPTRYYLKKRDNARIYKVNEHIREIGLEHFSLGMKEHSGSGWGDNDYNTNGKGAYDVHGSHAVKLAYVVNSWVKNVATYKPAANSKQVHTLSNCLQMLYCRFVTVDSCDFGYSQYEGGGGNGYMYIFQGEECLVKNSRAVHSRHNYDFKSMQTSGNVIYNCIAEDSRLATDFHMHLSPANLMDNMQVDRDYLEAKYRPYGTTLHGHPTTQSVFWNTNGIAYHGNKNYIVQSAQFGWGYVIGTQGAANNISTPGGNGSEPIDFVEGEGDGQTLEPQSLYLDQLQCRLAASAVKSKQLRPGHGLHIGHNSVGISTLTNLVGTGHAIKLYSFDGRHILTLPANGRYAHVAAAAALGLYVIQVDRARQFTRPLVLQ